MLEGMNRGTDILNAASGGNAEMTGYVVVLMPHNWLFPDAIMTHPGGTCWPLAEAMRSHMEEKIPFVPLEITKPLSKCRSNKPQYTQMMGRWGK